ncbi:hypothetical protein ig2599ANME_1332 [groundwater metagenome]
MNYIESIDELEMLYNDLTKEGGIGGSHLLRKISELCNSICLNADHGRILPSFVLSTIFNNIALSQEERPITTDECKELHNLLNDSIKMVINDLKRPPSDKLLVRNIEKLISDYCKRFKP